MHIRVPNFRVMSSVYEAWKGVHICRDSFRSKTKTQTTERKTVSESSFCQELSSQICLLKFYVFWSLRMSSGFEYYKVSNSHIIDDIYQ